MSDYVESIVEKIIETLRPLHPASGRCGAGNRRPARDARSVYRTVYQRGNSRPNWSQLEPWDLALASQIGGFEHIMSPLL